MIGRLVWFAALLGIAVVAVGVQLDRQARKTPELAVQVPEVFRSSAQPRVTALAIDSGVEGAGVEEAQKLLKRRPMPARHLRLLAQAHFAAGGNEASALAIQYAAQRGWRDALAQESMLRLALDAGDADEAARRYAALFLRRDTEDELLLELGAQVLAKSGGEGRQTLIAIVGGGKRWHNHFLRRGTRVIPSDAFAEIVTATAVAGADYDCRVLQQIEPAVISRDPTSGALITAVIEKQC